MIVVVICYYIIVLSPFCNNCVIRRLPLFCMLLFCVIVKLMYLCTKVLNKYINSIRYFIISSREIQNTTRPKTVTIQRWRWRWRWRQPNAPRVRHIPQFTDGSVAAAAASAMCCYCCCCCFVNERRNARLVERRQGRRVKGE